MNIYGIHLPVVPFIPGFEVAEIRTLKKKSDRSCLSAGMLIKNLSHVLRASQVICPDYCPDSSLVLSEPDRVIIASFCILNYPERFF